MLGAHNAQTKPNHILCYVAAAEPDTSVVARAIRSSPVRAALHTQHYSNCTARPLQHRHHQSQLTCWRRCAPGQ
jgi:hypothetical protein